MTSSNHFPPLSVYVYILFVAVLLFLRTIQILLSHSLKARFNIHIQFGWVYKEECIVYIFESARVTILWIFMKKNSRQLISILRIGISGANRSQKSETFVSLGAHCQRCHLSTWVKHRIPFAMLHTVWPPLVYSRSIFIDYPKFSWFQWSLGIDYPNLWTNSCLKGKTWVWKWDTCRTHTALIHHIITYNHIMPMPLFAFLCSLNSKVNWKSKRHVSLSEMYSYLL